MAPPAENSSPTPSAQPTKMARELQHRSGHAGIRAILDDIFGVLPPEHRAGNPGYKRCRTTFGLMQSFLLKAETSDNPIKDYIELQKIEPALRQRLQDLKSAKGVPANMTQCLDELKHAFAEMMEKQWTAADVIPTFREFPIKRGQRRTREEGRHDQDQNQGQSAKVQRGAGSREDEEHATQLGEQQVGYAAESRDRRSRFAA